MKFWKVRALIRANHIDLNLAIGETRDMRGSVPSLTAFCRTALCVAAVVLPGQGEATEEMVRVMLSARQGVNALAAPLASGPPAAPLRAAPIAEQVALIPLTLALAWALTTDP